MADFIILGEALCLALDSKTSFTELWEKKKVKATTNAIEASPAIMAIMNKVRSYPFEGTYARLLASLKLNNGQMYGLPRTAKGLADLLRRHAPAMQKLGVNVVQHKERRSLTFPPKRMP